jgi:hypothetical protein
MRQIVLLMLAVVAVGCDIKPRQNDEVPRIFDHLTGGLLVTACPFVTSDTGKFAGLSGKHFDRKVRTITYQELTFDFDQTDNHLLFIRDTKRKTPTDKASAVERLPCLRRLLMLSDEEKRQAWL